MKKSLILAIALGTALTGCKTETETASAETGPMTLDSEEKRIAYGMGLSLGSRFKNEPFTIDVDAFSEGLSHGLDGTEPLMSQEEIAQEMQAFQQKQMEQQRAAMEKQAADNKAEGEKFLAENAAKEGVVTTESGLQYKVIKAGEGDKPAADDTVEVHYKGTLIDGTEFDSSHKRGSTVSFPVNGVIAGWTEALQLMPVGSTWELYIPSDLAYGPGGTGGPIGPNATLIFEVELVDIKKEETPAE